MGQLKQAKLSRRGTAKVCPEQVRLCLQPQNFSGPHRETLLQRLSRLDLNWKCRVPTSARGVNRGEVSLIELTGKVGGQRFQWSEICAR